MSSEKHAKRTRDSYKRTVLVFCGFYLPGFLGGGPIRTIANLVDSLGGEFDFFVVAMDRDLGDAEAYASIERNSWNVQGRAKVFYVDPGVRVFLSIASIIFRHRYDILYLNSFFSFQFAIFPLILCKALKVLKVYGSRCSLILGPRGEFSVGALEIKSAKKKAYLKFFKLLGLQKKMTWHASTEHELHDIERVIGVGVDVQTAIDLSTVNHEVLLNKGPAKRVDFLRIVFVSRISPKKNLIGALSMLRGVRKPMVFDVYGPLEDECYWAECLARVDALPSNIKFSYKGVLRPGEVLAVVAAYDLLYFPTFGENYGHVIAEAIQAGLPVLISDQTPWRDLEGKKLGWDISLNRPERFIEVLEECCEIESTQYAEWRRSIAAWAKDNISNSEAVEANRRLFLRA